MSKSHVVNTYRMIDPSIQTNHHLRVFKRMHVDDGHALVTEHCTGSEHGSVADGTQPSSSRVGSMLWFHIIHTITKPNGVID